MDFFERFRRGVPAPHRRPASRPSFRPNAEQLESRLAPAAGFKVAPLAGLTTTEKHGTAAFQVQLTQKPAATVLIPISSSNPAEGAVSLGILFGPNNWNTPQTVTITGLNDFVDDGNVPYQILLGPAQAAGDPQYNNLDPPDVSVTNLDDDTAGLLVSPASGLIINERGTKFVTVRLTSQPTANVRFPLQGNADAEVSTTELVFAPFDWNVPKSFGITGADDGFGNDPLNDPHFIGIGPATSADQVYSGRTSFVSVTIRELRAPTIMFLSSSANPSVAGKKVTFTATLFGPRGSTPTGKVTVIIDGAAKKVRLKNGQARYTTPTPLKKGKHIIKAVYKGTTQRFLGSRATLIQFVQGPLKAPTPLGPLGTIATTAPTYAWKTVAGADFYDIQVKDATTNALVFRNQHVAGTSLPSPATLTPGHNYQWQIRALANNGNRSPWSKASAFLVPAALKERTFKGDFEGFVQATIILPVPSPPPPFITNITTYDNFISGNVTLTIKGNGSAAFPYQGTLSGAGQNFMILRGQSQIGAPGAFTAPFTLGPVTISSHTHFINAEGTGSFPLPLLAVGAGFRFKFEGEVSPADDRILGVLTITIDGSVGFGYFGEYKVPMNVIARKQ